MHPALHRQQHPLLLPCRELHPPTAAPGHGSFWAYEKVLVGDPAGDPAGVEGGLCSQKHQLSNTAKAGIPKAAEPADVERLQQCHQRRIRGDGDVPFQPEQGIG